MKKIFLSLICCFGILGAVSGASVSKGKVVSLAVNACNQVALSDFSSKLYQIIPVSYDGEVCYYVVQFQSEGWALVAADDRVAPVLGYSDKGVFDHQQMPEANRLWLNERASVIKAAKNNSSLGVHPGWSAEALRSGTSDKIEPLIKVTWNQSGKYAQSCPVNNEGKRALVGCVAVAIGQALSVMQYPVQPMGEIGYEDDDMGLIRVNFDYQAPYDWKLILSREDDSKELARFLYHCGVIVKMDYGYNASGAYTNIIPKALKTYFSFSDSVKYYSKNTYSSDWKALLLKELSAGRPIIYSGYDPDGKYGHAFNLDGFDGSNSFHVNWGWGGMNDGYFSLDNLHDGNFGYRDDHSAVVGLIPKNLPTAVDKVNASSIVVEADAMSIRVTSGEKGVCKVYDSTGKLLLSRIVEAGQTILPFERKGFYIVSVQCKEQISSFKLMK